MTGDYVQIKPYTIVGKVMKVKAWKGKDGGSEK